MYISFNLFKDIKKMVTELKTYAPVIEALTLARVITIVGLSTAIVLQNVWAGIQPCIEKIEEMLVYGIQLLL